MVPLRTALIGIVMLPKPMVPLSPVTVKDTVVELLGWFVVIVTLDIWALVMFPLIARSIVEPLSVVAGKVVDDIGGVDEGVGEEAAAPRA